MPDRLDDAFHSPARLQLAAFLSGCDEAVFGAVMERCQLSKSTLSKSVRALEDIGYLSARKGYHNRMPRTWLSLTPHGRQALGSHLTTLRQLADQVAAPAAPEPSPRPSR